jgi:hypothetical protein
MSALSIQPTYPIFTDIDGQPLEAGYVWIGATNLDPQTNPVQVYWDAALTLPAAQPIRTLAGYPANNGTPARLYVNSDYSIRVMNRNGSVVYSAPEATERYSNVVISGVNADNVIYDPPFLGGVQTNVEAKLRETVSVKDFGAVGDYDPATGLGTDDTAAIQAAINSFGGPSTATGGTVYFPNGNYKITAPLYLNYNTSLLGEKFLTFITASGDFEAIRWSSQIPSYSRHISIDGFRFVGAGKTSGFTNNTAIRIDHPWGIDHLNLKNLWITGFAGYGIQTDQQGSNLTTNCFQFSHWDTLYIKECGVGILMGEGFCGESVFSNITVQNCTTYGLEFSIGPVAGNQGQHWDTFIVGQCPTGIYFGAGNSGNITFTNAHVENNTSYGVRFNNSGASGITFNQPRFVNNPVGVQCDAGGVITFNGGSWQTTGSAGDTYITVSATSNFSINLTGNHRKSGSTPTNDLVATDIGSFEGAVSRKGLTTGTIIGRYDTKLRVQVRGIMSETATVGPNNLCGEVAIGSGASTVSVTLPRAESDANYFVYVQVSIAGAFGNTWQPACTVDTIATTGFRVYFSSAAPSAGFALRWMIAR